MVAPKVIILTGASRGIGLAVAHFLLKRHCRLVVLARSKEPLEQLHSEYPDQVQVLAGDLSDMSLGQKAADLARSKWQRIDSLIVNHGVLDPVKRISDADPEEWRKAFDINVHSAVALIKAAIPSLRETRGRIIFTSSGASINAYSGWGSYGASKAALNHLTLTLSVEEPEIMSIAIRPGVVDTEMQRELREVHNDMLDRKDYDKFFGLHKSGRLLKPEQPGHVIARLALDGSKELSGRFLSWNDNDLALFQEPES